jgi:tetratricopeptide (TPR) repeat protein
MTVDVDALKSRLASVNHRLVPTSHIAVALHQGASVNQDSPDDFIVHVINLSRANPILGTAFALGAYQSSTSSHNSTPARHIYVALGIALSRWGYFAEALPLLTQARAADVRELDSHDLFAEWHTILCRRRIRPLPDASDQLIEIARQLEAVGSLTAAMQCRRDAAAMYYLPSKDGKIEQVLGAAQSYFEAQDIIEDLGICLVIKAFACLNQMDFEGALELLVEAERLFVKARMPTLLSYTWQVRGQVYLVQRRMKEAKY